MPLNNTMRNSKSNSVKSLHLLGNISQLEKKYEKVQFGDILDLHNIIHQVKLEFVVAVGFGGIRMAFDFRTWGVAKMVWGI